MSLFGKISLPLLNLTSRVGVDLPSQAVPQAETKSLGQRGHPQVYENNEGLARKLRRSLMKNDVQQPDIGIGISTKLTSSPAEVALHVLEDEIKQLKREVLKIKDDQARGVLHVDEYQKIKTALDGLKSHYYIYCAQQRGENYGVSVEPEVLESLKSFSLKACAEAQNTALRVDVLHSDLLDDRERTTFIRDLEDMNLLLLANTSPLQPENVGKLLEIASRLGETNKSSENSLRIRADDPKFVADASYYVRRHHSIITFKNKLNHTVDVAIGNAPDAAPLTTSVSVPHVTEMAPPSKNRSAPVVAQPNVELSALQQRSDTTSTEHSPISPVNSIFSNPGNGENSDSSVSGHSINSSSAFGNSHHSLERAKELWSRLVGKV